MAFVYSRWYVVVGRGEIAFQRWISSILYDFTGNTTGSALVSELIYGFSNSLVLLNDCIIQSCQSGGNSTCNESKFKLKFTLTILENMEVFIEMSAKKMWGERGRWVFITIVQMMKCICRFLLTFKYLENVLSHPPIQTLDRKKIPSTRTANDASSSSSHQMESMATSYELKRSDRIVRKIEGSPPINLRTWQTLNGKQSSDGIMNSLISKRDRLLVPEMIHTLKPLVHLLSCSVYGENSWESYCVALSSDLISLRLHKQNYNLLSADEKLEMSRRYSSMLMYLIRTPFYERYTEKRIVNTLTAVGSCIPFSELIQQQIMQFIHHWREAYFYMWWFPKFTISTYSICVSGDAFRRFLGPVEQGNG